MKKIISYIVYWIIQCTWGIIMTTVGAVTASVLLILGYKPKNFGPTIYFEVGENWGGVELGGFFICSKDASIATKLHECGHSIQNLMFGPLMPFIVSIPSAIRYWLRTLAPSRIGKSLFNLYFLLTAIIVTTLLACITGPVLHWRIITIGIELIRIYFLILSIWLTSIEIPKYDKHIYVPYDGIWFEKQASFLGEKYYEKKEG